MWSTLHPLFQAENVVWKPDQRAELRQFLHQDNAHRAVAAKPDAAHARNRHLGAPPPADRARRAPRFRGSEGPRRRGLYRLPRAWRASSSPARSIPRRAPAAACSSPGPPTGPAVSATTTSRRCKGSSGASRSPARRSSSRVSRNNIAEAYLGKPDRTSASSPARSGSATASRRARSSGIPISGTPPGLAETMPSRGFPRPAQRLFRVLGAAGDRGRRRGARLRRRCGAGDLSDRRRRRACRTSRRKVTEALNKSLVLTDEINAERIAAGASRSVTASG